MVLPHRLVHELGLLGAHRLGDLAVVAVDRERLDAHLPGVEVELGDVLDGGRLGHVGGLRDRARDERLHGAHHRDVAVVVDRAIAHRAVEHGQVLGLDRRRPDDRVAVGDVGDDRLALDLAVAEHLERQRHRAVDDRELAAADQALGLDQREVGLDAGGVAVHQERDRPRGREHGGLRVAVAVLATAARAPRPRRRAPRRRDRRRSSRGPRCCRPRRGASRSRAPSAGGCARTRRTGPCAPRSRRTCGRRGPS